jgi:transcriptional regulator with XRE-family HTH domain
MFWNEYGPFTLQTDGFPNAGEVVRYFRKLRGYSASYVASELGITERRILMMESNNTVPDNITRRKAIVALLGIPAVLLGIADVVDVQGMTDVNVNVKNTTSIDLDLQCEELPLLWNAYHAGSTDKSTLSHINRLINILRTLESKEAYELLSGYYRLLSRIYRDKLYYDNAENAVKHSEKYALEARNDYLYANAALSHGRAIVEIGRTEEAIQLFKEAYSLTPEDATGTHGTAAIELAMAVARLSKEERKTQEMDKLVQESYGYASILKADGSHTALNVGVLALYRVDIALQIGSRDGMEDAIQDASVLMPIHHTYRHSLLNVYQSQYSLVTGSLYGCLASANSAYDSAISIDSRYQLALLKDIARRLETSKYSNNKDVQAYIRKFTKKERVINA